MAEAPPEALVDIARFCNIIDVCSANGVGIDSIKIRRIEEFHIGGIFLHLFGKLRENRGPPPQDVVEVICLSEPIKEVTWFEKDGIAQRLSEEIDNNREACSYLRNVRKPFVSWLTGSLSEQLRIARQGHRKGGDPESLEESFTFAERFHSDLKADVAEYIKIVANVDVKVTSRSESSGVFSRIASLARGSTEDNSSYEIRVALTGQGVQCNIAETELHSSLSPGTLRKRLQWYF